MRDNSKQRFLIGLDTEIVDLCAESGLNMQKLNSHKLI